MSKIDVVDISLFREDMKEMIEYAFVHKVRLVYYVAECCCITHIAANNYICLYYMMSEVRNSSN